MLRNEVNYFLGAYFILNNENERVISSKKGTLIKLSGFIPLDKYIYVHVYYMKVKIQ